ncbi:MAG TPA: hypothetical protein VKB88_30010, partial [Bryobacteraceae bacterium]|nr:hypothetical protein [Bryobacteraceae bacterium]
MSGPPATFRIQWNREHLVGKSERERGRSVWRLDPNLVVHSITNPLLAAKISLSCLYRDVPKQKLDLLQFAS